MKKTLIIGSSPNPFRYSYKAAHMLTKFNHEIVNIGVKSGEVAGVNIERPESIHHDMIPLLYISGQHCKSNIMIMCWLPNQNG